jgi:predicted nuclease of restriction endonuclease-like (RecB) superfamily
MKHKLSTEHEATYTDFLLTVKNTIRSARLKVSRTVNRELIELYWSIGKEIVDRQALHGWGKSIVERLSADLNTEFSGVSGFSVQNLWYMRQFYLEYQSFPNLQQLVGEIPWGQNLLIMSKIKDGERWRRRNTSSTSSFTTAGSNVWWRSS